MSDRFPDNIANDLLKVQQNILSLKEVVPSTHIEALTEAIQLLSSVNSKLKSYGSDSVETNEESKQNAVATPQITLEHKQFLAKLVKYSKFVCWVYVRFVSFHYFNSFLKSILETPTINQTF